MVEVRLPGQLVGFIHLIFVHLYLHLSNIGFTQIFIFHTKYPIVFTFSVMFIFLLNRVTGDF